MRWIFIDRVIFLVYEIVAKNPKSNSDMVSKDKTADRQIFDEVNTTEESLVGIGQEKCSLAGILV